MGADYKAEAVIGLRVTDNQLYTTRRARAFPHNHPDSPEVIYDPKTGRKLWVDETDPIKGFDSGKMTLNGYKVTSGTDHRHHYIALRIADDTYSNAGNDDCMVPLNHLYLNDDVDKFRSEMVKAGIWDEKYFGLWAVLYCSY